MTENSTEETTSGAGDSKQRWIAEVQEALDRTGDALRTAWEATRESRMSRARVGQAGGSGAR